MQMLLHTTHYYLICVSHARASIYLKLLYVLYYSIVLYVFHHLIIIIIPSISTQY